MSGLGFRTANLTSWSMRQARPWRSDPQTLDADEDAVGDPLGRPLLWSDGRLLVANGRGRTFLRERASGQRPQTLTAKAICRDAGPAFTLTAAPERERVLDGHRIRDFACFDSLSWKRLAVYAGHTDQRSSESIGREPRQ